MLDLKLVRVLVEHAEMTNNVSSEKEIQLGIGLEFKVDLDEGRHNGIGKIKATVKPSEENGNLEEFRISVSMNGFFISPDELNNNDELSKEVYNKLFPHLQSYISSLTALSGMPAFMIPEPPINQIYKK